MNHLEVLKAYRAWWLDEGDTDPLIMPEPVFIGEALDWAISELTERPSEHQLMEQARTINELQCHIERLRFALGRSRFDSLNQTTAEYSDMMKAAKETPRQSLAEIHAEAVERAVSKTPEHKIKVDNRIYHSQRALLDFAAAIRQEAE